MSKMSCFTVNKFVSSVVSRGSSSPSHKPSPSPKRRNQHLQKNLQIEIVREELGDGSDSEEYLVVREQQQSPNPPRRRAFTHSPGHAGAIAYVTENDPALTISCLRDEMVALSARYQHVCGERDYLEKTVSQLQLDKIRMAEQRAEQLDAISARYEERLVELHSVIAELTRQLETMSKESIKEEEEENEDEEDEDAQGAQNDKIPPHMMASDIDSRTSTDIIDDKAVEAGERLVSSHCLEQCTSDFSLVRLTAKTGVSSTLASSSSSLQVMALQEELSDARERNLQLTARLQQHEGDLTEARQRIEGLTKEKEALKAQLRRKMDSKLVSTNGAKVEESRSKVAERKRLKKVSSSSRDEKASKSFKNETQSGTDDERKRHITGSDLSNIGIQNGVVAQHLVQDFQDHSSLQELSQAFSKDIFSSGLVEDKLHEFEIEMERLSSRIEHLKSQNEVLSLTLEESKSQSDDLSVLLGKHESNSTAHALMATYSKHIVECLEVINALLEAELEMLLTQSSNIGESAEQDDKVVKSAELRGQVELLAQKLLHRLDSALRPDSGLAMDHKGSTSSDPWDEASSIESSHNTSSVSPSLSSSTGVSSSSHPIFSNHHKALSAEETRIRDYLGQLKAMQASVRSTIVQDLDMVGVIKPCTEPFSESDLKRNRTADLEMAVLVQELMSMREDRSDLRAKVFRAEREKKSLELIISSQQAHEIALNAHIDQLQMDLENQQISGDDSSHLPDSRSAQEPAHETMKRRITELLQTLEKVKRNSELRQQHQDEVIVELKKTNSSLTDTLDRTRRKYQQKLKRLEQQILQPMIQEQLGLDTSFHCVSSIRSSETEEHNSE